MKMERKAVSGMPLILLIVSLLIPAFHVQPAKAIGTIYIRADGSVSPPTAPISTVDNITYFLTDNITTDYGYDGLVVERSNIIIEGNQYTLQGVVPEVEATGTGIYLSGLSNVTVREINIRDFGCGICINLTTSAAILSSNVSGGSLDTVGISLINSPRNIISGNEITGNPGISLESSSNNSIFKNTIFGSWNFAVKIRVSQSSNNNWIYQNKAAYGDVGVQVYGSNNRIWGNAIPQGDDFGSELSGSNNTVFGNGLGRFDVSGFNNTVSGNNLRQAFISGVNHTCVGNLFASGRYEALYISDASYCNVSGNRIDGDEGWGIEISSSLNNIISGNNITNEWIGIAIGAGAANNLILHNNFIANTQQASAGETANIWDDGYPSGGNYWSDYDGDDLYTGPYQNEPGSDGIGDVPYLISAENRDNYPFMTPFENAFEFDIAIVDLLPASTVVPRGTLLSVNATVMNKGFSQSPLTFNLTVEAAFIGDTYSPVQRDFRLQASAAQGWNYTIPGPDITCFLGDTVALTMEGVDNLHHKFYVDYNGNAFPDSIEPQSPPFIKTTITYEFNADTVGSFTYYCAYSQNTMLGTFLVNPWPPSPVISSRQSVTLLHEEEKNVTFTWDTTGWFIGDYTISSFTDPVLGEVDIADNTKVDGTISVTGGPPSISAVSRTPFTPNYDEDVVVSATITDDKEVEEALLSYTGNSVWHNVSMNKLGDSFSASIPAQPFDALVQYKIYANDTDGIWATSELHSYTVGDFTAPEVRFSQTPSYPLPGQKVKVYANVTEPTNASGVKDPVFFSYRVNSGPWWNSIMVFNSGLGLYEITIPAYEKHDIVEYFVKATDNAGNINTTATLHYEVLRCDANHNGVVDVYDIFLIAKAWMCQAGQAGYLPEADINEDGIIDNQDLNLVNIQYGKDP